MMSFSVSIESAAGTTRFDGVTHFIGTDGSGRFGILPGHAPLVAVLAYGLVRFQAGGGQWRFAALPGGVLTFRDNLLRIVALQYFCGDDAGALERQLRDEMQREDSDLRAAHATLSEIERSLVQRLAALTSGRSPGETP